MTQPQPFPVPFRSKSPALSSSEHALMLLGPSTAMAQLWTNIRRLAPHVRCVLLTGEPDCGQEAVARVLLDLSPHAHRSFMQLTAAEAEARLLGNAGIASLPTDIFLFLPEVDRFSLAAQDALLRLIRMRRGRQLTIVASSSEDLRPLVALGRFSAELAEALSAVRLAVPPLKERREDLPMLLTQMLAAASAELGRAVPQPAESFLRAAMQYSWPGNLRELSQTLTVLCSRIQSAEFCASDLHENLPLAHTARRSDAAPARLVSLDSVMREHIAGVLQACRGNKLKASEVLGISRSTLYRMLDSAAAAQKVSLPIAS